MIGSLRPVLLRAAGMLLLAVAIFGCADRAPPPPPSPPVAAIPSGPVQVDGIYAGTKQLVRSGAGPGALCGSLDPFSVTVAGRAFHYVLNQPELPYQTTRAFDATIDADGSFKAVNGPATIAGNAGGGAMQGEISGDACGYVFQADRQGQ